MNNPELDSKLVDNNQPQEQKASIVLNVNEINIVLAALQELPHRISDPIIRNVMTQAQAQIKPPVG